MVSVVVIEYTRAEPGIETMLSPGAPIATMVPSDDNDTEYPE